MVQGPQRNATLGQWLGLFVFLFGIGLMLLVFTWAARLFNEIGVGKELLLRGNPKGNTVLGEWIARWLVQVVLLFVLGYIASLIAARGIHLFVAARSVSKG